MKRITAVVTGGKIVTEDGRRYWWPDGADTPGPTPLGPEWQAVGYTEEA